MWIKNLFIYKEHCSPNYLLITITNNDISLFVLYKLQNISLFQGDGVANKRIFHLFIYEKDLSFVCWESMHMCCVDITCITLRILYPSLVLRCYRVNFYWWRNDTFNLPGCFVHKLLHEILESSRDLVQVVHLVSFSHFTTLTDSMLTYKLSFMCDAWSQKIIENTIC